MTHIFNECKQAIENERCFECNEYYNCDLCDYVEERCHQVRLDTVDDFADKCIELQSALFTNASVSELNQFKFWLFKIVEQLKGA